MLQPSQCKVCSIKIPEISVVSDYPYFIVTKVDKNNPSWYPRFPLKA